MHQETLPAEVRTLSNIINDIEDPELRRELLLAVAEMLHALAEEDRQEYYH